MQSFNSLKLYRLLLAVLTEILLVSCGSLPTLDSQITDKGLSENRRSIAEALTPARKPPTLEDLLAKLQCEIYFSIHGGGPDGNPALTEASMISTDAYVATAILTADIQSNDGINASLSFLTPKIYSISEPATGAAAVSTMYNLTKTIGGQWSGMQHKQYTQTFSMDLERANENFPDACKDNNKLKGSLRIREIMEAGLHYGHANPLGVFDMPQAACDDQGLGNISDSARPVFGSTIDFTIVLGLNGGPSWTLERFKGPSGGGGGGSGGGSGGGANGNGSGGGGGNQGLLNFTNTEKNTLVISFAPALPGGAVSPENLLHGTMKPSCRKVVAACNQDYQSKTGYKDLVCEKQHAFTLSSEELGSRAIIVAPSIPTRDSRTDKADAVRAASQNNTQMILQSLLNNNP
jgi:uncharacterized membrane protein YgcG